MSEPEKYSILWDAQRIKELEADNARLRAVVKKGADYLDEGGLPVEAGLLRRTLERRKE